MNENEKEYLENFRRNLVSFRKENKLSQEALGELCNLSTVTIAHYEGGLISPKLSTFVKIASALNVSPENLLKRKAENEQ